jgi:hypothetical protein
MAASSASVREPLLRQGGEEEAKPRKNAPWLILVGLGVLAAFYLSMNMRTAKGTLQSGRRDASVRKPLSLFKHYERRKLVGENTDLKQRLAALESKLVQRDSDSMERARAAAAVPDARFDNSFMKIGAAAARTEPTMQQTLAAALGSKQVAAPPPNATNPYRLTPELIKSRCDQNNIILVTFVNSKRADYGYTWASHSARRGDRARARPPPPTPCAPPPAPDARRPTPAPARDLAVRRLKLQNYLIGAMDGEALKKLVARGIPTFDMESGLTTADYGWGTKNFRQLGLRKTELIIALLRAGADPILTDADALITRDPSPFIARLLPDAQILVTSDHLMSTTTKGDQELEVPERAVASAWNIGYMYLHHSVLPAMLHWQAECVAHPTLWDQNLFKDVLKIGGLHMRVPAVSPTLRAKRLFLGYNRTVKIGIFPVSTFCSGHTYFVQRMPQRMNFEPYSVHTTFQYSGAVGKTHRLREAMMWDDGPEYFDPRSADGKPRGFLSYTHVVKRELIKPAGKMDVVSHFTLVNHQLVQIRAAFLLARRLNRLLILPEIVCGLDRFWAPHNGTIPGSDTQLPIDPCPADHVIDLEHIAHAHKGTVETVVREWSFLQNSRLPSAIKTSMIRTEPPAGLSTTHLASLLEPQVASTRVLHFSSMPDLYATLPADEGKAEQQRMKEWTSIWCCSVPLTPKSPGHIWYDFFWDVVPRKNRHGKIIDRPFEPLFGP